MHITEVTTHDAKTLTSIAMLAKAHWGYDKAFMAAAKNELAVDVEKINTKGLFFRCMRDPKLGILAFYCVDTNVSKETVDTFELDGLFTRPDWIGKGLGQQLFIHACDLSRKMYAEKLLIQSDPFAEGFYQKMGCETIGQRESGSIAGRMLPMMEKQLS